MSSQILEILKENGKKIDKASNRLDCLAMMFNVPEYKLKSNNGGVCYDEDIDITTVFQTKDTTVTLGIWHTAQAVYPAHVHKESTEYLVAISGRFLLKFAGAIRIMSKGECASIPRGIDHIVTSLEDESQMLAICVPPEEAYK